MKVIYCDLCNEIIKGDDRHTLYIAEPHTIDYDNVEEYMKYLKKVERGIKEICPTCKHIFDKIFEYRLQGLSRMTKELEHLFSMKPKNK